MAKCAQKYQHQLVISWLCQCVSAPSNCTLKELFRNHRNHFSGWANHCEDYSWIRVLFVSIHFSGGHWSKCVNVWGSWRTKMDFFIQYKMLLPVPATDSRLSQAIQGYSCINHHSNNLERKVSSFLSDVQKCLTFSVSGVGFWHAEDRLIPDSVLKVKIIHSNTHNKRVAKTEKA